MSTYRYLLPRRLTFVDLQPKFLSPAASSKLRLTPYACSPRPALENSEALEVPTALLRRLYEIEDISTSRHPLPTSSTLCNALRGDTSASARKGQEGGGLSQEEASNFLQAFEMSGDGDEFPARVAWELQSEFWAQQDVEVMPAQNRFSDDRQRL